MQNSVSCLIPIIIASLAIFPHTPANQRPSKEQVKGQLKALEGLIYSVRGSVASTKSARGANQIFLWSQPNLLLWSQSNLPVESTKSKSACRANPVCLWSQPNLLLWTASQTCLWSQSNLPMEPTQSACGANPICLLSLVWRAHYHRLQV